MAIIKLDDVYRPQVPAEPVRFFCVQFSLTGERLFAGGGLSGRVAGRSVVRRNLVCWDIAAAKEAWSVQDVKKRPITSVAVSEGMGRVGTASELGEGTIRDSENGQIVASLPDNGLRHIALAGTRHFIGCSSWQGRHTVSLWDAVDGHHVVEWFVGQGVEKTPDAAVCSPSGKVACVMLSVVTPQATMAGQLVALKLPELTPLVSVPLAFSPTKAVFIGDSDRLAVIGRQEERYFATIVNLTDGRIEASVSLKKQEAQGIAYVKATDGLCLLRGDHSLEFRDLERLELTHQSQSLFEGGGATDLAISQLGQVAVSSFGVYEGTGAYAVASLPKNL